MTRFLGSGGQDLTDVVFEVSLEPLGGFCEKDGEDIAIELTVPIQVALGPADDSGRASFRYFVAIADQEREVIAREAFDLDVPVDDNLGRVAFQEVLYPRIPVGESLNGAAYKIYVGLELTPDELAYNRARR